MTDKRKDTQHRPELPRGDRNENPRGVSLVELVREDLRTHDDDPFQPGFWALAVHRFGNWRMDLPKPARAPLTVAYRVLHRAVMFGFGIDLGYTVKVGRRVRIWHHGGMVLGARAIGDDVHIRHNTTFGLASRADLAAKPIIGDRVDIGAGACILGDVVVGHDAVIGANTVVVKNVAPHSVVFGVPARPTVQQDQQGAASGGASSGSFVVDGTRKLEASAAPSQEAEVR